MQAPERSVLHVLPHPGGGGETYVDLLDDMPGYRFARVYLAPSPSPTLALTTGLVDAARRARGCDLLHIHGDAAAALCLPLLATRPSVVTLHGLNLVRRLPDRLRGATAIGLHAILRAADRTICVSESERVEVIRRVGAIAAQRTVVVRNGVRLPARPGEAERADARLALGIGEAEVVAIWVGSLDTNKDPLTLIRAVQQAPVTVLVAGDGPLRRSVERAADARVRVLGRRSDVPRLLAAADLYVSTSRREGLSLSLLEAMAHELAVLVIDLPENLEAIGDAGISVPPGDDAVAEALRLLAADPHVRADLGKRASERASRLFDASEMARRTRAVYEHVLMVRRPVAT